jgi:hypothetical protein
VGASDRASRLQSTSTTSGSSVNAGSKRTSKVPLGAAGCSRFKRCRSYIVTLRSGVLFGHPRPTVGRHGRDNVVETRDRVETNVHGVLLFLNKIFEERGQSQVTSTRVSLWTRVSLSSKTCSRVGATAGQGRSHARMRPLEADLVTICPWL